MRWAWLLALAAAGVLLFWLGRRSSPPGPLASELPKEAQWVSSSGCRLCHEAVHAAWTKTAHAMALRAPGAAQGAFDGKPVGNATPRREAGNLSISVADPRVPGNHRVTHVVGGRVEESYLFTDARGAWRLLPISWNVARKEWEPTAAVFEPLVGSKPPDDVRAVAFNTACAPCHVTRFDPGYRLEPDGREFYEPRMVEAGVGCEACHGAGSVHAQWHREKRAGDYAAPAKLGSGGGSGACLRCHYAYEARCAIPDDPRAPFEDFAVSRNFDGPGFFPDGRLATDRHAGTTFVQSKCAAGGATCLSCHAVHRLSRGLRAPRAHVPRGRALRRLPHAEAPRRPA